MKVSVFQPTYLSWIGFYKIIEWADHFVFLNDVQYENHSWQTRNRIKGSAGPIMLTVPIVRKFPQDINQVKINYATHWVKKHLKSIEMNYSRSPYFEEFYPRLEKIYQAKPAKLVDLNINIIKDICDFLDIKTDFYDSTDLKVSHLKKNEKVVAILKKMQATQYVHGVAAWEYMQPQVKLYEQAGIKLIPCQFDHPVYPQLHGDFVPYMSIIDAIFNCGKEKTKSILQNIKFESL